MSITVLAAFGLIGLAIFIYKAIQNTTRRRDGEPPLEGGSLPWIGVGLQYVKLGMSKLIETNAKKHGDIFTIFLNGKRMHVTTNPIVFTEINKMEAKGILSTIPYRLYIMPPIFGFDIWRPKIFFDYENSRSDTKVFSHVQGLALGPLTLQFQDEFLARMEKNISREKYSEGGLWKLVTALFVPTSTKLFFGDRPYWEDPKFIADLLEWNRGLSLHQKGNDPNKDKFVAEGKRRIYDTVALGPLESSNDYVKEFSASLEASGMNPDEIAASFMALMWALNMNSTLAGFWALYHVLSNPDLTRIVLNEIEKVIAEEGGIDKLEKTASGLPKFTYDMILKLDVVESVVHEAIRLSSGSFVGKGVMEDCVLKTYKGDFKLRKDDFVIFSTAHAHTDPEIYADPTTFKYDRFLKDPETRQMPSVTKDGHKVSSPIHIFSDGKHKCPGRYFAINELKLLFLSVFTQLEVNFADNAKPEQDPSYAGIGVTLPKKDVPVRYRMKSHLSAQA